MNRRKFLECLGAVGLVAAGVEYSRSDKQLKKEEEDVSFWVYDRVTKEPIVNFKVEAFYAGEKVEAVLGCNPLRLDDHQWYFRAPKHKTIDLIIRVFADGYRSKEVRINARDQLTDGFNILLEKTL